jgi:hypothetical protein
MWAALKNTYRNAWRFAVGVPLIAGLIVALEGTQHMVEWSLGMYESLEGAKAAEGGTARMAAGAVKVGALILLGYWVARFVIGGGSAERALAADPVAVRKFVPVVVYSAVLGILTHAITGIFKSLGLEGLALGIAFAAYFFLTMALGVALMPWTVGAAVADEEATPLRAFRISRGSVLWGLGFTLLVMLPPMAVHYGLNLGAIGRPPALAAAMLIADSLFVGFLGILLASGHVTIAQRMADRSGHKLPMPLTRRERTGGRAPAEAV